MPSIQMCDALSRNTPKLIGVQILLAYCLSHGRRQFVDIAPNFPEECRYVLEALGEVYYNDALSRERKMSPEEREAAPGFFLGRLYYEQLFYVYVSISLFLCIYLTYGGRQSTR